MKKILKKNIKFKKEKVIYTEKKSFLADKEIIFRSSGRAKVFNISHRLQVFVLSLIIAIFCWSGYNYYYYHTSSSIINKKDRELGKTRDAYIDLMSDITALQNNLKDVVASLAEADSGIENVKNYKEKTSIMEDKIKQLADSENWIDQNRIQDAITKKEALLQKEMLIKENKNLRFKIGMLGAKLQELQENVKGLESAEIAILEKIEKLSGKEIEQIKSSLSQINKTLKSQNRYFNPLANIKEGKGGVFVPAEGEKIENQELIDKLSKTFKNIDLIERYKEALSTVPLGKPVFKYRLSSRYGKRNDPFKKAKIARRKGLDMGASTGSRISAQAAGKVIFAGFKNNGSGNLVVIDHGNGFVTKYAHMHKIYVKEGDKISYNQAIGEVGSTGRSTGSHLHYEVLYNGANVNPLTFVNIRSMNES